MAKDIRGFVVQELMTRAQYDRGLALIDNAIAAAEAKDLDTLKGVRSKIVADGTKPGHWFDHWKRTRYSEAVQRLSELRRHMPERSFRIRPAILTVEGNFVQAVKVLEWEARA